MGGWGDMGDLGEWGWVDLCAGAVLLQLHHSFFPFLEHGHDGDVGGPTDPLLFGILDRAFKTPGHQTDGAIR